jgi:hypothetical protein
MLQDGIIGVQGSEKDGQRLRPTNGTIDYIGRTSGQPFEQGVFKDTPGKSTPHQ